MGEHLHDDADAGELRALARRLFEEGARMMRLKPDRQVSESVRGLPAVMHTLSRAEGPLSPGALAKASGVTDARMANILRVLEGRGIVERRASTADRRRVEVTLTDAGRAEERDRIARGEDFMVDFLADLGADDARDLVRLLGRVNDTVERRRAEGRAVDPISHIHGSKGESA